MQVKFKKVRPNAVAPFRATPYSAGYDLSAAIDNPITLKPGVPTKIPTGIAIQPEHFDCVAMMYSRSGYAKNGITLGNSVGVIDSDYRGEIQVTLINNSNEDFLINPNERVAQIILFELPKVLFEEVDELDTTVRGDGGHGSTGK